MATSDPPIGQLRSRVRQQEVVAELSQQALESPDLDRLLADAAAAVSDTLEAEYAAIFETLPDSDAVVLRHGVGWDEGVLGATVPSPRETPVGSPLDAEEPVVLEDLRSDGRDSGPDLLADHDVISGIAAAVGGPEEPQGVFGIYTTESREFTDQDIGFVARVADVVGAAIENRQRRRDLEAETVLMERIVETSPTGIVVDADGEITFANERAEDVFGRSRAEITALTHDDPCWDARDEAGNPVPADEMPFQQVVDCGGAVFDVELNVRRPDDTRAWLSVNGAPLGTDGDDVRTAVFAVEDLTERKRLESELETMFDRITDAFFGLNTDWEFTYVNDRARELIDPDDEGLIGRTIWDAFPGTVDSTFEREYRGAMERQEPTSFEEYFPPLETWFEVHAYPSPSGLSVYFRDVTDRKEMERELEQNNRTLQRLYAITADRELSFDEKVQELLDLGRDRLGLEVGFIADIDERDDRFEVVHASGDDDIVTKDGESIPYEFVASALEAPSGDTVLTGIGRDITARRESQRRLEELVTDLESSNERLEQFAYAASHDLQEPLRMVASYLTLVERRYADELDADGQEFIEYAVDGATRMQEMIDGLLAYSRVDTKGDSFEVVDCEAVLADVLTDLEVRIEETDAEISVEPLPCVWGDPDQLRQVFQNLLDNAITYSGVQSPRISVFAEKSRQEWTISVRDRGIGIDPADADRIFQVFDRLHSIEAYDGTGIGLALCQRIVERHDGDIRVDSMPGEGSTFSVTLPAPPATDDATEPTEPSNE